MKKQKVVGKCDYCKDPIYDFQKKIEKHEGCGVKAQKVWCLFNTETGRAIKVAVGIRANKDIYAMCFATKNDLLAALCNVDSPKDLEFDEQIRRVEIG